MPEEMKQLILNLLDRRTVEAAARAIGDWKDVDWHSDEEAAEQAACREEARAALAAAIKHLIEEDELAG
jgi:hypothetical protein